MSDPGSSPGPSANTPLSSSPRSESDSDDSSSEPTDTQPSRSSPPRSSVAWWRSPERTLAVVGAIALRWSGKLPEFETAIVLMVALGAPVTGALLGALRRVRGK